MLQHRERKNGTALVYKSFQGTGKNIFWGFGDKMFGERYYLYINDMDQLTKNFKAFSVGKIGKILTVGDEVTYGGGHKANAKLKSRISQIRQLLKKKGIDAVQMRDFQNFVFLTNDDLAVKIETSDRHYRRYAVSECSDCFRVKTAYFTKLAEGFDDPEVAAHFFSYLMRYDLSSFNLRDIPDTQARKNMRDLVKDSVYRYFDTVLEGDSQVIHLGELNEKSNKLNIYREYICGRDHSVGGLVGENEKRMDAKVFGRKFREYMKLEGIKVEQASSVKRDRVKVNIDLSHVRSVVNPDEKTDCIRNLVEIAISEALVC